MAYTTADFIADVELRTFAPTDRNTFSATDVLLIATMPTTLRNKKLKVEFYCSVPSVDVWRVSVYDGTTRLALSTDTSGATTLPAGFVGKFTTYVDTTSGTAYSVNFTKTTHSGTANLDVTSVIFGPGIQPQGAVVGPRLQYTPTFAGFGTVSTQTVYYSRIGDVLYVAGTFTAGTTDGTTAAVSLPSGLTVATVSASQGYPGRWIRGNSGAASRKQGNLLITTGGTGINFASDDTAAGASPFSAQAGNALVGTGEVVSFFAEVPIAEWVGSGTNLAQNEVEYASNSSTSDADDTTSFVYGPNGGALPGTLTAARSKRIRFQTPLQATDALFIEVLESGGWLPYDANSQGSLTYVRQNTTEYGIYLNASNSTDVDVIFNRYSLPSGATYGAAGTEWGATTAVTRWRVRKVAGGQAVGFGLADTSGNAGLVNPYNSAGAGVIYHGTYTPTYTRTSDSFTVQTHYYVRIGNIVHVHGYAVSGGGGGTNTTTITLPITPSAFSATSATARSQATGGAFLDAGSARISGTASSTTTVTLDSIGNGATGIGVSFSYRLA